MKTSTVLIASLHNVLTKLCDGSNPDTTGSDIFGGKNHFALVIMRATGGRNPLSVSPSLPPVTLRVVWGGRCSVLSREGSEAPVGLSVVEAGEGSSLRCVCLLFCSILFPLYSAV